jgi:predicted signal transduction protein with EAL and GGDEF domain
MLKVDRSFLEGSAVRLHGLGLLRAMVEIGAALGVSVVAEGIETPDQARLLRSLGFDSGQGFLLSPPLDPPAVEALLSADRRPWDAILGPGPSRSVLPSPDPSPAPRATGDVAPAIAPAIA